MDSSLINRSSAWAADEIESYLRDTVIPIRIACSSSGGTPLICSLWYLYDGHAIRCATQASAKIARLLERNPHCGFEIAGDQMPYRGVRGQGQVKLSAAAGPATLDQLIDRYLQGEHADLAGWLRSRSDSEVAIIITPEWLTSWDFAGRMGPSQARR